jgi:quercetin dioxygenase-like cupin family protein
METKNVGKTMQDVESRFCSLMETISLFNSRKGVTPINKEQLKQFPIGVWIELNSKVKARRRKDRFKEGYLCFDTVMETGGEFGEHFHDDLIESTEVMQGEMYDTQDGRYYRDGDVAHYDKGQKHTPIATKKTILHVLFKP